uniref:Tetraspanin n=1 Tax=Erpetoichthys calabaricus TaxID=27687 RepID=A0A8C4RL52_ERPCA
MLSICCRETVASFCTDEPPSPEAANPKRQSGVSSRSETKGRRRIMALLKLSLMGFSFVFWAAGLAMFTVGIWAKISLADYLVLSTNRYPNTPFILLTTGAAVIIWGFLGCFSAATENRCLLRMYGIFQLAVLVAGLSAGLSGLFYRKDIAEGFQKGLQEAIRLYTEDEVKADALDDVQRALDCCGVHSYQDWLFSPWSLDQEGQPNGSVPSSCCVQRRGCRNRPVPTEGAEMAGIHTHGCFQKVFDFVSDNMFHIATGALSLATIQVVGIVLTCLLAAKIAGPVPQERARAPVH